MGGTAANDREKEEKDLVVKDVPILKLRTNIPPFPKKILGFFLFRSQLAIVAGTSTGDFTDPEPWPSQWSVRLYFLGGGAAAFSTSCDDRRLIS
jgi:hypothetical protein